MSMSIKGLNPHPDTLFNKTFHHRNDSDVFEASRYFSGEPTTLAQKMMMKDENQNNGDFWNRISGGARRISLDMPTMRNYHHHSLFSASQHHHHHHNHTVADQKQILKEKKHKQPSSPGGRLASFLNSLFSQSASKKKKPKSTHDQDPGDSPGGGRSSISHFSTNPNHSTTIYSVSSRNSAFPTSETPNKTAYWSVSGHKETIAPSLPNKNVTVNGKKNKDSSGKIRMRDERSNNSTINKYSNLSRDETVLDDGAESDSSSDLFELQNFDLGDYSSGLPVYETTHMDSIKRGAPISVYGP